MTRPPRLPAIEVRPGQVWIDLSARCAGRRRIRVDRTDDTHASCTVISDMHGAPSTRRTRIRLARFQGRHPGYRLHDPRRGIVVPRRA